ncbi:hypothetical protein [Natronospora cellulosivora (SeqCode)]
MADRIFCRKNRYRLEFFLDISSNKKTRSLKIASFKSEDLKEASTSIVDRKRYQRMEV